MNKQEKAAYWRTKYRDLKKSSRVLFKESAQMLVQSVELFREWGEQRKNLDLQANELVRRREVIEEMERKWMNCRKEIEEINVYSKSLMADKDNAVRVLADTTERLAKMTIERNEIIGTYNSQALEYNRVAAELDLANEKIEQQEKTIGQLEDEKQEQVELVGDYKEQVAECHNQIGLYQKTINSWEKEEQDWNRQREEYASSVSMMEQQIKERDDRIMELKEEEKMPIRY